MTQNPIALPNVQAVLFDLDGTLVETHNRWAGVLAEKLAPIQRIFRRFDARVWGRRLVMAIETPSNYAISTLEHLGLDTNMLGISDRIRRSKGLATRRRAQLIDGSQELLLALKSRYKLAVVTTRARPEALAFVEQTGFAPYFDAIVTRQDGWWMKPHPGPVRRAAAMLGVDPRRCIMIGDTTMDIRSARRAGAFAVGVLSGFGEREELERAGAHLILDRAEQLLEYLP
jgi:HAD superfamily hydrolase (TIGR01509 family)